jgi:hypothetical protein
MKLLFAGLLVLYFSNSIAQPPVIDSLIINEQTGILAVYGDFGSTPGKIWCDGFELVPTKWTDTIIYAAIPDSGKGSAGPVLIGSRGYSSDTALISMWKGRVFDNWAHHYSNSTFDRRLNRYDLYWRYDINSRLKNKTLQFVNFIQTTRASMREFDETIAQGSNTHFIQDSLLLLIRSDFNLGFQPFDHGFDGDPPIVFEVDSLFLTYGGSQYRQGGFSTTYWYADFTISLPPLSVADLFWSPSIISPRDSSLEEDAGAVNIEWKAHPRMQHYHLQISSDPNFTTLLVDTTISISFLTASLLHSASR